MHYVLLSQIHRVQRVYKLGPASSVNKPLSMQTTYDRVPSLPRMKALKPKAQASTKATYGEFRGMLKVNLFITCVVLCTVVTAGALVANEYTDTHWTIHYWLEGDNSLNGDTFRHISTIIPAFTIAGACLLINILFISLQLWEKEECGLHCSEWGSYRQNAMMQGLVGVAEALITLIFTQVTGNSNLWAIIYVGFLSLFGDLIGASIRVFFNERGTRGGSSRWAPIMYLCVKMTPLVFLAISADRIGLPTNVKVAFWLFFSMTTFRVTVMALAQLAATFKMQKLYRHLLMQPIAADMPTAAEIAAREKTRDALATPRATYNQRMFLGAAVFINFALTLSFILVSNLDHTSSVSRQVYERITWTLTHAGGEAYHVEFDRVWGVLQVAVPLQFGLLMVMGVFYAIFIDHVRYAWTNVADFFHDLCYAVGDFFFVWVILNMSGTTELSELLLGSTLIFACDMLFAESRSRYSRWFMLVPSLVGLLPFAHASSNIAMLQNRSRQELAWTIVAFVAFFIRNATFWGMRIVAKYSGKRTVDYVNTRYIFNWLLRWIVVGIWLSGSFHHGQDINNNK